MLDKLKPKSEFTKNVLTLMTGTTIAQAIPIAISPILTRIYTPEDFGVLALYLSIVTSVSIIVAARYEMAIVLPKKDSEAINILALSLIIIAFISILSFIFIYLFKEKILLLLNSKEIGNFIYFIPISIFLVGLFKAFNYWSNRKKEYKIISKAQIYQSGFLGLFQISFGFFKILGGLILGNILARFVAVFIFVKNFLKEDKHFFKDINLKEIKRQMVIHKDFPLVNSLHAFSDIIRTSGSVMLISIFFGAKILGFYSLSLRVLQMPITIIGSALSQVLYQKFTTLYNENNKLYPFVKSIFIKLIFIALPIFALLYFITPQLFAFVFGKEWKIAGEYSQILIPYLFMSFLISPLSTLAMVIKRQKTIFYISLFGNSIFILTILVFKSLEFKYLLSIISTVMVFYFLFVIIYFRRVLINAEQN